MITLVMLLTPGRIFAVSCTTQAQMPESERTVLVQAVRTLASAVQSGNVPAVQALTIPKVKAQFDPIANTIEQTAPLLAGATITIDALYGLDASDLKAATEDTVFFCGVAGSPVHVDVTIPQLPQGRYALTLVHATGVKQPQQMAFLLQKSTDWQLAGLFVKPLLMAGHDSVWYWTKARAYRQKGQKWNAYFYYTTAAYLATPADFMTSANLDKLNQETAGARPDGLPGAQPMEVKAGNQAYSVSDVHTDGSLGGLDLVLRYTTSDAGDPVATRARNLELMKAMLAAHPELRDGFHGLWVFAEAPSQRPYGNELAMSEIH
ncbi:MAG TPA: hypothetical protein VFE27_21580 [Acidobacteriaceae bacterium]|nr:hypothetical protein [Acidobacteriaceae bacterium]